MSEDEKFFGKYRGKVENNIDPFQQGRLQVSCPAVFGEGSLSWAMPCAPFAGSGVGFFALPPVGANVWVEFEAGDPDYPIWSGCFWNEREAPVSDPLSATFTKVIQMDAITLTLSDAPGIGGVTLEVNPPAVATPLKMVFNAEGIELSNGAASVKLTLMGVSINNGALEVI
jgi:hypothetical protein